LTKYKLPEDNKDSEIALAPHCDKATLSLICENGVQGLQVLSKTGNWVDVNIPRNGFAVLVGDMLKVISTYI
jgi:isopenicillin N synthase-like dioxygenase